MKSGSECLLSKDMSLGLKGYLAVCVFIHHLYQCTGFLVGTYTEYIFYILGRWATVVFVFLSGYGLYSSYKNKGDAYIRSFPRKRLLPYYISCLFFVLIYILYNLIQRRPVSISEVLASITIGGTVVIYGWYLHMALVFYLIFLISFRFFKSKRAHSFSILLLMTIYLSYCFISGLIYYIPALSIMFFAGITCSLYEEKIISFLRKHNFSILIISALLFIGFSAIYMSRDIFKHELPYWALEYPVAILAEIAEIVFIISSIYIMRQKGEILIANPISKYIGKHSLEIYACQGLFFDTVLRMPGNIHILVLATITITIIGAVLIRPIISCLTFYISKLSIKYLEHN